MKEVIIINGSGGNGKDTFIEMFAEYFDVINFSSIGFVKAAASILGWESGKTEKDRRYLSDLKDLSIKYCDAPFKETVKAIKEFNASNKEVMFLHIREPEEIQKIVRYCNAKTLIIKNDNVEPIETNKSDGNVLSYVYDYTIDNSKDLDNLSEQAAKFAEWLLRIGRD